MAQPQRDRVARHCIWSEIELRRLAQRLVGDHNRAPAALFEDQLVTEALEGTVVEIEILDIFYRRRDTAVLAVWLSNAVYVASLREKVVLQTSTPFLNRRTYGLGNGVDLVMPSMDHRVAVEVANKLDDALLQLVL